VLQQNSVYLLAQALQWYRSTWVGYIHLQSCCCLTGLGLNILVLFPSLINLRRITEVSLLVICLPALCVCSNALRQEQDASSSGCGLIECVWSDGGIRVVFGPWSACSVACGVGVETRRRVLCSPAQSRPCQKLPMTQTRRCVRRACKPGISQQYYYLIHDLLFLPISTIESIE